MIIYTPSKPAEFIPMVDLQETFIGGPAARRAAAWQIHQAARDTGFFYVRNHGIDQARVDGALAAARRFFEQPLERKLELDLKQWPGMLRG
jgi:isopenicillin N synthase-like dioxygenase